MTTAAVLHGAQDLRIEEREIADLGPHQVLVSVEAVGVCGSDEHYFREGRIGRFVVDFPLVLGHEGAGRVVTVGSDVTAHHVGDHVAIEPGEPCWVCEQCRHGNYNLCDDVKFMGTPPTDGCLAREVVVLDRCLFSLPNSFSFEQGALLEPLSVAIWAVKQSGVKFGDKVLVTGAGPIGLLSARVAALAGAESVTISDLEAGRLDYAASMGVERCVDRSRQTLEAAGATGFDVLIECSGSEQALTEGIWALGPKARVGIVGIMHSPDVVVPLTRIRHREITVVGVMRYAHTWPQAIRLVESGAVEVSAIVSDRYVLAETERALTMKGSLGMSLKPIVLPNQ